MPLPVIAPTAAPLDYLQNARTPAPLRHPHPLLTIYRYTISMYRSKEDEAMRGRWCGPGTGWAFGAWRGPWEGEASGEGAERLERGLLRFIVLDVLEAGPKHGYEIIKEVEQRTHGRYSPSPGTVYPTLQHLSDLGLITSDPEGDRRVYRLTEAGRAEWRQRAERVKRFWARFGGPHSSQSQAEMSFVADELQELARTVWSRLGSAVHRGDPETLRRVRLALERCKNEVRQIIAAAPATGAPGRSTEATPRDEAL